MPDTTPEPRKLTPREEALVQPYAGRIRQAFSKSTEGLRMTVASWVEAGQQLQKAKDDLGKHGLWLPLLQQVGLGGTPKGIRRAEYFMAIARHPVLSDFRTNGANFPNAWTLLRELARLSKEEMEAGMASGEINPEMSRADVDVLVRKHKPKRPRHRHQSYTLPELQARKDATGEKGEEDEDGDGEDQARMINELSALTAIITPLEWLERTEGAPALARTRRPTGPGQLAAGACPWRPGILGRHG